MTQAWTATNSCIAKDCFSICGALDIHKYTLASSNVNPFNVNPFCHPSASGKSSRVTKSDYFTVTFVTYILNPVLLQNFQEHYGSKTHNLHIIN